MVDSYCAASEFFYQRLAVCAHMPGTTISDMPQPQLRTIIICSAASVAVIIATISYYKKRSDGDGNRSNGSRKKRDNLYVNGTDNVTVEKADNHVKVHSTGDVLVSRTGTGNMTVNSQGSAFLIGPGVDPVHREMLEATMNKITEASRRLREGNE